MNAVCQVRTKSDHDHVVTGSEDRTLRLWRLSTGECECVMEGHGGEASRPKISPRSVPDPLLNFE